MEIPYSLRLAEDLDWCLHEEPYGFPDAPDHEIDGDGHVLLRVPRGFHIEQFEGWFCWVPSRRNGCVCTVVRSVGAVTVFLLRREN